MTPADKTSRYVACIYNYGIIPLLKVLEEYEAKENYEECNIILQAIKVLNTYDDKHEQLPTRYTNESIGWLKTQFSKYGLTGDTAIGNIPHYMALIKKEVA